MKKLVIQVTAEAMVSDDFKLTSQNYSSVEVQFDGKPLSVRNATVHVKEPKAAKKRAAKV